MNPDDGIVDGGGGKCDQDSPKWAQGAQQISRSGKAQSGDCGLSISNHVDKELRDCVTR